jgi:hypothetical protein
MSDSSSSPRSLPVVSSSSLSLKSSLIEYSNLISSKPIKSNRYRHLSIQHRRDRRRSPSLYSYSSTNNPQHWSSYYQPKRYTYIDHLPDLDLDLDIDLDPMPFRKNHVVPSPLLEQCINPKLANKVVLQSEQPYFVPDHVQQHQVFHSNVHEPFGGSSSSYSIPAHQLPQQHEVIKVKQEYQDWVPPPSPFESWQSRPVADVGGYGSPSVLEGGVGLPWSSVRGNEGSYPAYRPHIRPQAQQPGWIPPPASVPTPMPEYDQTRFGQSFQFPPPPPPPPQLQVQVQEQSISRPSTSSSSSHMSHRHHFGGPSISRPSTSSSSSHMSYPHQLGGPSPATYPHTDSRPHSQGGDPTSTTNMYPMALTIPPVHPQSQPQSSRSRPSSLHYGVQRPSPGGSAEHFGIDLPASNLYFMPLGTTLSGIPNPTATPSNWDGSSSSVLANGQKRMSLPSQFQARPWPVKRMQGNEPMSVSEASGSSPADSNLIPLRASKLAGPDPKVGIGQGMDMDVGSGMGVLSGPSGSSMAPPTTATVLGTARPGSKQGQSGTEAGVRGFGGVIGDDQANLSFGVQRDTDQERQPAVDAGLGVPAASGKAVKKKAAKGEVRVGRSSRLLTI